MMLSAAEIEISLHGKEIYSLKEKRTIVKSILKRVSQRFNVSIAETSDHDDLNRIVLGIASVSVSKRNSDKVIQGVIKFIELEYHLDLTISSYEV